MQIMKNICTRIKFVPYKRRRTKPERRTVVRPNKINAQNADCRSRVYVCGSNAATYHNGVQTTPPCDKIPLVRLNPVRFTVNVVIEKDRSTVHGVLSTLRLTKKSWFIYYNLMNTLNTSSCVYTAIFHSPSAYDAQSDRLWHLSV